MFLEGPCSLEVTAITSAFLSLTLSTVEGSLTSCVIFLTYFARVLKYCFCILWASSISCPSTVSSTVSLLYSASSWAMPAHCSGCAACQHASKRWQQSASGASPRLPRCLFPTRPHFHKVIAGRHYSSSSGVSLCSMQEWNPVGPMLLHFVYECQSSSDIFPMSFIVLGN